MAESFAIINRLQSHLGRGTRSGDEVRFECPYCREQGRNSKKRKLYINVRKQLAHCWVCGYKGSIKRLLRDLNGGELLAEDQEVLTEIATVPQSALLRSVYEKVYSDDRKERDKKLKSEPLPKEAFRLKNHLDEPSFVLNRAFKYLRKRGVKRKDIKRFDIHYCPDGEYAGYLIFPVYQYGRCVYFASRYTGSASLKSKNPPKREGEGGNLTHHTSGTCLLNFDSVRGKKSAAIVEGPFDCMAFENAVAAMGKSLTARQVSLIEGLAREGLRELVIALDANAVSEAEAIYEQVQGVVEKPRILYLDSGDPHENRSQLKTLCEEATDAPSFKHHVLGKLA